MIRGGGGLVSGTLGMKLAEDHQYRARTARERGRAGMRTVAQAVGIVVSNPRVPSGNNQLGEIEDAGGYDPRLPRV